MGQKILSDDHTAYEDRANASKRRHLRCINEPDALVTDGMHENPA